MRVHPVHIAVYEGDFDDAIVYQLRTSPSLYAYDDKKVAVETERVKRLGYHLIGFCTYGSGRDEAVCNV